MDLNTALNFGLFKYSWSPKFAGPIVLTLNQLRLFTSAIANERRIIQLCNSIFNNCPFPITNGCVSICH